MDIFKSIPQFNPNTGEPENPRRIKIAIRCDFSGRIVDGKGYEGGYPAHGPKIILDYESSDPCFGAGGGEWEFGEKYHIDMFQFLSQPYVIFDDVAETGESEMPSFLKALSEYDDLAHALRAMRIKTATKLVEEGLVKPEGLEGD